MRESLQKYMKQGLSDFTNLGVDRKEWVKTHFGQVVATVSQIVWCSSTEVFIGEAEQNPDDLSEWYTSNVDQLK